MPRIDAGGLRMDAELSGLTPTFVETLGSLCFSCRFVTDQSAGLSTQSAVIRGLARGVLALDYGTALNQATSPGHHAMITRIRSLPRVDQVRWTI